MGSLAASAPRRDPEIIWGSVGTVLLSAALAVVWLAPGMIGLLPRCMLKAATGWPCPTCGLTRAAQALAAGQPLEALLSNPLVGLGVVAGLAYLPYAWLVMAGLVAPVRTGWLRPPLAPALRWGALGVVALNWVFLAAAGR